MPIEFDDPAARTPVTRRVLMLCDRWSDWSCGRAVINQMFALGLCSYGGVEVYRCVRVIHQLQKNRATLCAGSLLEMFRAYSKSGAKWLFSGVQPLDV